ncbi:MAG TPA: PDDEXK nuclease domain-containing protein [Planctomycetota bacterium]
MMPDYERLLADVKSRVDRARLRAAASLNEATLRLYWDIGRLIVERQEKEGWGDAVIERLARDLKRAFPDARGFSRRNLFQMRLLFISYRQVPNCADASAQLGWSHNVLILRKIGDPAARLWYLREAARNGWSVRVLRHQIDTDLYRRQALSAKTHNFRKTLPPSRSDLAEEMLKDPYRFDFIGLGPRARERDLERALVNRLRDFLLELGVGFAFVGRQYRLEVGGREHFIDLLFYHLKLRSYVAIDLKMGEFEPADLGQMNFYLSALDDLARHAEDLPSIGLILCREKNRTTVEYALRDLDRPVGVAEWQSVPGAFRGCLPSPEQLAAELEKGDLS